MEISKLKQEAKLTVKNKKSPFIQATLIYIGIALLFAIPYLSIVLKLDDQLSTFLESPALFLVILTFFIYMAFVIVVPPMFTMAYVKSINQIAKIKESGSENKFTFSDFKENFKKSGCGIGNFWWTYLWTYLWMLATILPFALISTVAMSLSQANNEDVAVPIFIILILLFFAALTVLINRSIAYSMNWFVLAEHQETGVIKAMKISKLLTKNHKGKLFLLELSFIGWGLLTCLTCGLLFIWIGPYYAMTKYNAYKFLLEEYAKSGKEPLKFVEIDNTNYSPQDNPYFANNLPKAPEQEEKTDQ